MRNHLAATGVTAAAAAVITAGGGIYANAASTLASASDRTLAGHSFLFTTDPIPLPGGPPAVGVTFVLAFTDATHMTYTRVAGPTSFGRPCENETVQVTSVRPGVFFTRWIEASGIAVSHVDDLRRRHAVVSSVIPTSLTGASTPISVSFTGSLVAYAGKPQAACPNNGSGQ